MPIVSQSVRLGDLSVDGTFDSITKTIFNDAILVISLIFENKKVFLKKEKKNPLNPADQSSHQVNDMSIIARNLY